MIYLKSYKLFESVITDRLMNAGKLDNQFFKTEKEIIDWLYIFGKAENVIVNKDLTVNASLIDISYQNLNYIPIQFGEVNTFICSENHLTSLKGSPIKVDNFFSCARNKLTSLKYCPSGYIHTFNCSFNDILSTKYLSSQIHTLYCDQNPVSEILNILPTSMRMKFIEYLNEYDAIIDNKIFLQKIKEVFYMMDIDESFSNRLTHLKNYIIID